MSWSVLVLALALLVLAEPIPELAHGGALLHRPDAFGITGVMASDEGVMQQADEIPRGLAGYLGPDMAHDRGRLHDTTRRLPPSSWRTRSSAAM